MTDTAVVEIGHRRQLAAIKKAAHKDKRRRRDWASAPILCEQIVGIEAVRRADHVAPIPEMARRCVSTLRDKFVPIRASIFTANYYIHPRSTPPKLKLSRLPKHRHFSCETSPQSNCLRAVERYELIGEGRFAVSAAPRSDPPNRRDQREQHLKPQHDSKNSAVASKRHGRNYPNRENRRRQPAQHLMRGQNN